MGWPDWNPSFLHGNLVRTIVCWFENETYFVVLRLVSFIDLHNLLELSYHLPRLLALWLPHLTIADPILTTTHGPHLNPTPNKRVHRLQNDMSGPRSA